MLLAINMPKMNGFEVLKKLKSDEAHKKIPIIMLTSSNSDDDKAKSLLMRQDNEFYRKRFNG